MHLGRMQQSSLTLLVIVGERARVFIRCLLGVSGIELLSKKSSYCNPYLGVAAAVSCSLPVNGSKTRVTKYLSPS